MNKLLNQKGQCNIEITLQRSPFKLKRFKCKLLNQVINDFVETEMKKGDSSPINTPINEKHVKC
jgi:hypothetical protein